MRSHQLPPCRLLLLRAMLLLAGLGTVCGTALAQSGPPLAPISPSPASRSSANGGLFSDPVSESIRALTAAKMAHLREEDRRKHLVADTTRLQALTGELEAELQKDSPEGSSPEIARKIVEIEKLAHDVHERMKN